MQSDGTLIITDINRQENEPVYARLGVPYTHIACMSISFDGKYALIAMTSPFNPDDPSTLVARTKILCLNLQEPSVVFEEELPDRVLDNDGAIDISNGGKVAVVSMLDGGIVIWRHGRVKDRRAIKVTNSAATVALDVQGDVLAVGGIGSGVTNIHLLDVNTLSQIVDYPIIAHDYAILSIDVSPDKSKIVSIDTSGLLRITPLDDSTPTTELTREKEQGASVKFSKESDIVLIKSANGLTRVRPSLNVSKTISLSPVTAVKEAVVAGNLIYVMSIDGNAYVHDIASNNLENVDAIDFKNIYPSDSLPNDSRHLTVEQKASVQLWDSNTDTPLLTLPWAGKVILAAGFVSNENAIVAISLDGQIKMWKAGEN